MLDDMRAQLHTEATNHFKLNYKLVKAKEIRLYYHIRNIEIKRNNLKHPELKQNLHSKKFIGDKIKEVLDSDELKQLFSKKEGRGFEINIADQRTLLNYMHRIKLLFNEYIDGFESSSYNLPSAIFHNRFKSLL